MIIGDAFRCFVFGVVFDLAGILYSVDLVSEVIVLTRIKMMPLSATERTMVILSMHVTFD